MKQNNKIQQLFIILYLVSYGLMLLNGGLFWDDWTIPVDWSDIEWRYLQNKQYFGFLHYFFQNTTNPPIIYRLVIFILYFFSIKFLFSSIDLSNFKDKNVLKILVLLAGVLPFNSARATLICFPFAVGNFMFFFSIWLTFVWICKNKKWLRVVVLFSFLCSFLVQSFIVAYLIPLLFILHSKINFFKGGQLNINKSTLKKTLNYIDFIALPFIFKIILFLIPSNEAFGNLYGGYNQITVSQIIHSPPNLIFGFIKNTFGYFIEYYNFLIGDLFNTLILTVSISLVSFLFLLKTYFTFEITNQNNLVRQTQLNSQKIFDFFLNLWYKCSVVHKLFLGGVSLFFIGLLPYVLVAKTPSFEGYNTRLQLLLPYGFSLILFSLILAIAKSRTNRIILLSCFLGISVTTTMLTQLQYLNGWFKQESIIINLKNNQTIMNNTTFYVIDYAEELDASERDYAFYSLNGMSKKAFGEETKLLCEYSAFNAKLFSWEELIQSKEKFNMKDYELSDFDHLIKIDNGAYPLSFKNTLKLIKYKLTGDFQYNDNIKSIINLSVKKMDQETLNFILNDS